MRVFLDTNVLVSAFASRGLCAELLEIVLLEHELISGRNVLNELTKALRQKVKLPVARAAEIVSFVSAEATLVVETSAPAQANAEPDDARVLGEALAGEASVFVTGDAALLKLANVATLRTLRILSPRQFWAVLRQ